jgi:hypothetical protein
LKGTGQGEKNQKMKNSKINSAFGNKFKKTQHNMPASAKSIAKKKMMKHSQQPVMNSNNPYDLTPNPIHFVPGHIVERVMGTKKGKGKGKAK